MPLVVVVVGLVKIAHFCTDFNFVEIAAVRRVSDNLRGRRLFLSFNRCGKVNVVVQSRVVGAL